MHEMNRVYLETRYSLSFHLPEQIGGPLSSPANDFRIILDLSLQITRHRKEGRLWKKLMKEKHIRENTTMFTQLNTRSSLLRFSSSLLLACVPSSPRDP